MGKICFERRGSDEWLVVVGDLWNILCRNNAFLFFCCFSKNFKPYNIVNVYCINTCYNISSLSLLSLSLTILYYITIYFVKSLVLLTTISLAELRKFLINIACWIHFYSLKHWIITETLLVDNDLRIKNGSLSCDIIIE